MSDWRTPYNLFRLDFVGRGWRWGDEKPASDGKRGDRYMIGLRFGAGITVRIWTGAWKGLRCNTGKRGMLQGTEDGRWISLPVRQKQPLRVRGTGVNGGLRGLSVWKIGDVCLHDYGIKPQPSPICLCDRMIWIAEFDIPKDEYLFGRILICKGCFCRGGR